MKGNIVYMAYTSMVYVIKAVSSLFMEVVNYLFIAPLAFVVDYFTPDLEKKSFAKNYSGAETKHASPFVKGWMYDLFSRQRVDPFYNSGLTA